MAHSIDTRKEREKMKLQTLDKVNLIDTITGDHLCLSAVSRAYDSSIFDTRMEDYRRL